MLSVLCNLYVFVIMRLLLSWKILCFDFSTPMYVSMYSRRESVKLIREMKCKYPAGSLSLDVSFRLSVYALPCDHREWKLMKI